MITLTLADTNNEDFIKALFLLSEIPVPASTSWKIGKIAKHINEENKLYEVERLKTVKKYAIIKDGEIQLDKHKNAKFEGDKLKEFTKELNELKKQEIKVDQIQFSLLNDIIIQPQILAILMDKIIIE